MRYKTTKPMKKYTIPFAETKSSIPFIRFPMADGRVIYALVDTGSESTMLDRSLMTDYPDVSKSTSSKGKTSFVGISGKKEVEVEYARIDIPMEVSGAGEGNLRILGLLDDLSPISSHIKEHYGTPESMTILIGSNCLRAYGAKIDLKKGTITFSVKEKNTLKKAC